MTYTLESLPSTAKHALLQSHSLANVAEYRQHRQHSAGFSGIAGGLFGNAISPEVKPEIRTEPVIWATDNYAAHDFQAHIGTEDVSHIMPRVQKAKDEQRSRTKTKAEVFTPAWVCNVQNSLIDDQTLYVGAFNAVNMEAKTWVPNPEPIRFTPDYTWLHYVAEKRLEMTAGEAPYLASRVDAVSGEYIPVRRDGVFQRIGLLDRKLRVVAENATDGDWSVAAKAALQSTYGYEWQGDNLLLARLNLLNTYIDYYHDRFHCEPPKEKVAEAAQIIAWNMWQMDGLKQVVPGSCSPTCVSCKNKNRINHDGVVSIIRWGQTLLPFEDMLANG